MTRIVAKYLACGFTCIALGLFAGCETREKMIDIQTPSGSVEVDKVTSPDGEMRVDVDVDRDKPLLPNLDKKLDVDVDVNR